MTFLRTSPRRKPSVPRAGAHRNGLRDVEEARTSPLLPPESRRLGSLISASLLKHLVYFAEKFGMYPTYSARNTDFFVLRKFWYKKSGTFSQPSGAPTPPNLRSVINNRNISRIGYFSARRSNRRIGEDLEYSSES